MGLGAVADRAMGMMDSAQEVLKAESAKKILEGLGLSSSGKDTAIPQGIGDLIGGVGEMMKASTEVQGNAMNMALAMLQKGQQGGNGTDPTLLALLLTMMQNQQKPQDDSKEWFMLMMQTIQEANKAQLTMVQNQLQEAKANSGGLTDQVMIPFLMDQLQRNMEKSASPSDPMENLTKAIQTVQSLQETLPGLLGSSQPVLTPEHLELRKMDYEHLGRVADHDIARKKIALNREVWKNIPQAAQAVAENLARTIGNLGFMPASHLTPEQRAYASQQANAIFQEG